MRTKQFLGLILLFLVFGIYSIGDKTLYADDINDLNTIIKQKVVDENHSLNDNIAHTSTIKNVDYLNFGNSLSDYSSNQVGKISTLSAEEPSTIVNYHTSEEYINGSFRINFWIDSIIGINPAAITAQISFLTEQTLHGPVSVQNSEMLTKEGNVTTGLLGYADFPAKTTFFAATGAWGMVGNTGETAMAPIPLSAIYLQNRIGQNFPQYIDPISKKDAESAIDTTWQKLPSSPVWTTTDRALFIKQFSETYGNQPAEYWKVNQVHHIRPRIYGGTNDFDNLMPILVPNHQLITTWFRNY